jgi:Tfp pilus assembly protein PilF
MDSLNLRIRSLEQERQAMGMALSQSREEALKSQAKMNTLTADFQAARQQLADLQRNMKLEREKSNQVTGAQLKQLQALEATIKQKDSEIASANNRISSLQKELQESKDAFQELRTERDDLLRERDHMAALLKLSESGRVQQLIEQNMSLAKELRESKERVELLNQNANENNDSLLEALRDLAITKSKILSLQKEKSAQDQRMNDLEKQLLSNEKSLGQGENTVNKQEAEALREIIKRQLRQQELRKKKAQVLLDAAKSKSTGDANYDEAIALLTDEKISLTPEEQKIVDAQRIDGEIFSPYAGSKDRVAAANTEMHEQIENFTKSAVRAFGANRLSASREVLEFILEDVHPGHIPTMTKLGIVQMRLEDYPAAALTLRNAIENDETRSNSHRLLGLALYKSGDMPAAEQSVRRALEIDPKDYRAYTLLGNTLFRANQFAEAQLSYEKAIELNPENADVYHNLALLHQRKGELKLARETYAKAIEYGSPPNPELESKLQ